MSLVMMIVWRNCIIAEKSLKPMPDDRAQFKIVHLRSVINRVKTEPAEPPVDGLLSVGPFLQYYYIILLQCHTVSQVG